MSAPTISHIAGHYFIDGPGGRRCACGKSWLDLLNMRDMWRVGAPGIAHTGSLTAHEVSQLEDEINRIWRTLS
jgi:hypothetical protein